MAMRVPDSVQKFLQYDRFAFVGVSRDPKAFSRVVYQAFLAAGKQPIPVNQRAPGTVIEGRSTVASVADIDPPVSAAFVMTRSDRLEGVMDDLARAGVRSVWVHGPGTGPRAVSEAAAQTARAAGMELVAGECPMMFLDHPSFVHRLHGAVRGWLQGWPKAVARA
jgi:hypothetical protein